MEVSFLVNVAEDTVDGTGMGVVVDVNEGGGVVCGTTTPTVLKTGQLHNQCHTPFLYDGVLDILY